MLLSQRNAYCTDTISLPDSTGQHVLSLWQQTLKATTNWLAGTLLVMGRKAFLFMEKTKQRKVLAELDNRLLEDIGITRATAMYEASKPFWR